MHSTAESIAPFQSRLVGDCISRWHESRFTAQSRASNPAPLSIDELASLDLTTLLIHSIKAYNLEHITFLLAQPTMLKQLNHNSRDGDLSNASDTANAFVCAAMLRPESPDQLAFKLQVCHLLLDVGFTNVNAGYYCMGVSGLTGYETVCHGQFWPGVDEEAHRQLAARVYATGGQPSRQTHPLAKSPYQLAQKYAAYLLSVVPGDEELSGQKTLWPLADLPREFSPAQISALQRPAFC